MTTLLKIDGKSLTIEAVKELMNSKAVEVVLDERARDQCYKTRGQIDRWLNKDAPVIYGINTGLGNLKDTVLSPEEHLSWNKTIPYPHAVGLGGIIDPVITHTALLMRANVLSRSYSAVRVALIDRMLSIYNAGIAPVIYELGSTGLSDLGPLAQSAMVVAGLEEADVIYRGERLPAKEAFEKAGLDTVFPLQCKEVLSQMNGSTMTQALALVTYIKFEDLFNKMKVTFDQNDPLISAIDMSLAFVRRTIEFENNISCDNPLLFEVDGGAYEAVMGCNCSNTLVGYVLDLITVLSNDLAISYYNKTLIEDDLKDRVLSLMSQLEQLLIPSSADSIATKGNQEDHVEFSYGAGRKAYKAVLLLEKIIG